MSVYNPLAEFKHLEIRLRSTACRGKSECNFYLTDPTLALEKNAFCTAHEHYMVCFTLIFFQIFFKILDFEKSVFAAWIISCNISNQTTLSNVLKDVKHKNHILHFRVDLSNMKK